MVAEPPRVALCLGCAVLLAGCARDPVRVAWEKEWQAAEELYERGPDAEALRALEAAERSAPTPVDADEMRLRRAEVLARQGRHVAAARLYLELGDGALRRQDRARARFELASMAESLGRVDRARALYRGLVLAYPELMPGGASLERLERLARGEGEAGLEAHLAWVRAVFPRLEDTELADDLLYLGAREAYRRWRRDGGPEDAREAEELYERIHRRHWQSGHWNDAMWDLSWLYERQGRDRDAVTVLWRILKTRQKSLFLGDYEDPYYQWGLLRIGRLQLLRLHDAPEALATYDYFAREYPRSRWRDDALFWGACAALRAGEAGAADARFAVLERDYPESKYLRRIAAVRAEPGTERCSPPPMEERP